MPSQEREPLGGSGCERRQISACAAETAGTTVGLDATLANSSFLQSPLSLDRLLALGNSRNCGEALAFLHRCTDELIRTYDPRNIPFVENNHRHRIDIPSAEQFGDLVYIPRLQGRAFIVSDVEGDLELIERIFRKERIIETLEMKNPSEQVFFISLGDTIDRAGYRASQVLEFLLDLKFQRGFRENIHILAGNHELSMSVQLSEGHGGFFKEVVDYRNSYSTRGEIPPDLEEEILAWFKDSFSEDLPSTAAPHRVALWREFNTLFSYSPKTVVLENGAVLCHGGSTDCGAFSFLHAPGEWPRPTFEQGITWLSNIPFDLERFTPEQRDILKLLHNTTVEHITWSDWHSDVCGTQPNLSRRINEKGEPLPLGLYYGSESLQEYLAVLEASVMVRGHQMRPPPGATPFNENVWFGRGSLVTVNSTVPTTHWVEGNDGSFEERIGTKRSYLEIDLSKPIRGVGDITIHAI